MKKFFKILGLAILLILALLVILPIAFKGKIMTVAKTEMNNMLNAKVDFGDLKLSFIKRFPDAYVELKNLSIVGINRFEGDTLVAFRSFNVKVDLLSVIKMKDINIKSVTIDHPVLNALVLKDGAANWDIMKDTTSTPADTSASTTRFSAKLKKFEVIGANIRYNDESLGVDAIFRNFSFTMSGNLATDYTTLKINSETQYFTFLYDGFKYISNAALKMNAQIGADLNKYIFTFKENELQLNDIALGFDGKFAMPADSMIMDMTFATKRTDFKSILSMVPAIYMKDYKDLQASGTMKLSGQIKGVMIDSIYPDVDIALLVNQGRFKYPALPASVDNVNVGMKAHYDGKLTDNSTFDMDRFHMEIAQNPVDAKLNVKFPISDPLINGEVKGKVDLANVLKVIPIDSTELAGIITANLDFMGRMSALEKGKYQDFHSAGDFAVDQMKYKSPMLKTGLTIPQARMVFSPQYIDLQAFDMSIGKSDMHFTGKVADYMQYVFSKGVLKADFKLTSNLLDVNEIMSGLPTDTTKPAPDTSQMSLIEVPGNIKALFTASFNKILYDKMVIENAKGAIEVLDHRALLKNVAMNMLQGSMVMNGEYNTQDMKKPYVDFGLNISDIDIPSACNTFNTVKLMAPVAANTNGRISSTLTFTSQLDQHMNPVYQSITGKGTLSSKQVALVNSATMKKIGEALKSDKFQNMVFKDLNLSFVIKNGRVYVDPFTTKVGSGKVTIGGDQGLDQTLNYIMTFAIPRSEMGAADNVMKNLQGAAAAKGLKIDLGENVNLGVRVRGTFKDPKVTPELSQTGSNAVESIKSSLKEEATAKVTEVKEVVKAKAGAEADKLIQQAEREAQTIRNTADSAANLVRKQANENADRLEAEAKSKPKFAQDIAKRAADKVRQEGENKARKIISEANTKADAVITKAKEEAAKLK